MQIPFIYLDDTTQLEYIGLAEIERSEFNAEFEGSHFQSVNVDILQLCDEFGNEMPMSEAWTPMQMWEMKEAAVQSMYRALLDEDEDEVYRTDAYVNEAKSLQAWAA